uniref:Uncharacterized protein n=1 Tax=Marseillevirus LCMAC101 TaxID=2506602 RepID=A0A481YSS9_9VIRU|nr:MAG: hypothetical protein LCMAC101_04200 [Marseillevirus LCMAC101]
MDQIREYVNNLTDDQINEIYTFYDSGGYDHLMRYPRTVVPGLDMSLRRDTLIRYIGTFRESPDPDVPNSVLDGTCSFDEFRYTLQMQAIGEPLMHRLNQGIDKPELGYSPVSVDRLREDMKEIREDMKEIRDCLEKVHGLLKEMFEEDDQCLYINKVLDRNDVLAEKAIELIEEFL